MLFKACNFLEEETGIILEGKRAQTSVSNSVNSVVVFFFFFHIGLRDF